MWPLVHFLTIQVFIFLTYKLIVIIEAVNVMANFCQWDNKSVSKLCMHAKLLQSCPTLCDPMGYSSPASSVHEILQARIREWVAIPSCRGSSQPRDQSPISYVSCIGSQGLKKETKFKEYSTEKGIESFEGKKGVQPHGKIMDLGEKMGKWVISHFPHREGSLVLRWRKLNIHCWVVCASII